MSATRNAVKQFITEQFAPDVSVGALDDDYNLIENGVIDSLSLLRLISWLGERFTIPVEDIDLEPSSFESVSQIDQFIAQHS